MRATAGNALAHFAPQEGWRGRSAMAAGFIALCAAPYYAQALQGWEGGGPEAYALFFAMLAGFFAAGLLIGRWWAVTLLVLAPLAIWPLGVAPGDSDGWTYAWLFLWGPWLFGAPLLLFGLVIRTGVRWWNGEFAAFGIRARRSS